VWALVGELWTTERVGAPSGWDTNKGGDPQDIAPSVAVSVAGVGYGIVLTHPSGYFNP
jgi:hypothetical protein